VIMQRTIYNNYLSLIAGKDFGRLRVVILSGLPGSGKSTWAGVLQEEYGYKYVSTDKVRVEMLKLTKGKFASTSEYVKLKDKVYDFVRAMAERWLKKGKQVVIDGTHLNEQLMLTVQYLRSWGVGADQALVVYVDAGSKSEIKKRFVNLPGINEDGRSWVEAWEAAYDYFAQKIKSGEVKIPENSVLGYKVVWVKNS